MVQNLESMILLSEYVLGEKSGVTFRKSQHKNNKGILVAVQEQGKFTGKL
jgi:hypothetical protein